MNLPEATLMDITGGALLEIAKQVPGLGVLVWLVLQLSKAQKDRDDKFATMLDAVQTRSQQFGREAMDRSEQTNRAMRDCITESTDKITKCVEENARALGKATQVIERHEKFYEDNCEVVSRIRNQQEVQ
jgi:hypothetical protein